ncbi:MAG: hypothetical protein IPH76_11865 [Xanthomonadales bacterium]|nr:hypothetical protein [Xanthomonadales bacterium]
MYRLLAMHNAVRERAINASGLRAAGLLATGPNQVWSWDIPSSRPGQWTYLYLRRAQEVVAREGIPRDQLTLHADRGAPMRSKTLAELLTDLGVDASFSRPHQSNDNPSREPVQTPKYAPAFPDCFGGMDHARRPTPFFNHYNHDHRHTGIGLMAPAAAHRGDAAHHCRARAITLGAAFDLHPLRCGRCPQPPRVPDGSHPR